MIPFTLSTLLAAIATIFFAITVFAPNSERKRSDVMLGEFASAVPPSPPPPMERWAPYAAPWPPADSPWSSDATEPADTRAEPDPVRVEAFSALVMPPTLPVVLPAAAPSWTADIDARAAGLDTAARCDLADALAVLDTPWARDIIARALEDEHDAEVRARLLSGRTGREVRPTPAYADES